MKKQFTLCLFLIAALSLSGCGSRVPDCTPDSGYVLTVAREGVYTILVSTPETSGGCIHADGTPFRKGEQVWLDTTQGLDDLRDVSVTALDRQGNPVWESDAAAETWQILPEN